MKNKTTAGLLALFLGGLGVHNFYLGKTSGIFYLLFCWTFIPAIIAFFEAIMLFTMSQEDFDTKYNNLVTHKDIRTENTKKYNSDKNWIQRHSVWFSLLILFIGFPFVIGVISSISGKSKNATVTTSTQIVEVKKTAVFDISGLSSSTLSDVISKLGEPTLKYMPVEARLNDGENPDITYKKDGEELIVTYNNKTKKVIDFFLSAREGFTGMNKRGDKQLILSKLGLTEDNQEYKVEYVKALKDENQFTGVILTKLDPLANDKERNVRALANSYIKSVPLKSPSTADYTRASYAKKIGDNTYEISSYVDSQNGFGAMIRSYWTIKAKYIGDETTEKIDYYKYPNNWEVVYLEFDGNKLIDKK